MSAERATALRGLPSVDQLLRRLAERPELSAVPRARLTALVRQLLDAERKRVLDGRGAPADPDTLAARVVERARGPRLFSPRPLLNATGVRPHTHLGRPLVRSLVLRRR